MGRPVSIFGFAGSLRKGSYNRALLREALGLVPDGSRLEVFELDGTVAIMNASIGLLGGVRTQYHLRQSFVFLDMYPVNTPEVFISFDSEKFNEEGRLLDEKAKELISDLLYGLIALASKLKA
jgi:NAD(P)H-dependent FMN reductase